MENLTVYILLVIAVSAGWLLGRFSRSAGKKTIRSSNDIFADYFVGLNYLLNDEPDEAIDTFIKALEINSETIETHLALGALLRRRGKVDKAIKVHQALLARPGLESHFSDATRLQLSVDYITAGLLDRAERLLNEVLNENGSAKWEALEHLITIYQTEKEWENAISCSTMLLANSAYKKHKDICSSAAHYCCELAQQHLDEQQKKLAREYIKKAFTFERKNIRASFLLAQTESMSGNDKASIKELLRIRANHPEFVTELLHPLRDSYTRIGKISEYESLLVNMLQDETDGSVALALCEHIRANEGDDAAAKFLAKHIATNPSLSTSVELLRYQTLDTSVEVQKNLRRLQSMLEELMHKKAVYQCHHCGYELKSHYWMCPSCKKWDKITRITATLGS